MKPPFQTISQALDWGREQLSQANVSDDGSNCSAALDSKLLLCHCLSCEIVFLHTWPENQLNEEQIESYLELIGKRKQGHPVAHLLGYRDFWSLRLRVSPATLIPRPETELMVEAALDLPLKDSARVLDLGTGTGAIALALASERDGWQITGVDKSADVVNLAKSNAALHHLDLVRFVQGDWFSAISKEQFDLIVTNPPYVETDSEYLIRGDLRFEPASALTSGKDGLNDIRHIVAKGSSYLVEGGWMLIEHGYDQHKAVSDIFMANGFVEISTRFDLNELPRVTLARKD